MHLCFGNLAKIRGIVYYRLSPHEQKTFYGILDHGVKNMLRRFQENIFKVAPPFVLTYALIIWADKENLKLSRKNPADYAKDE